jgi:hypothetical protein
MWHAAILQIIASSVQYAIIELIQNAEVANLGIKASKNAGDLHSLKTAKGTINDIR